MMRSLAAVTLALLAAIAPQTAAAALDLEPPGSAQPAGARLERLYARWPAPEPADGEHPDLEEPVPVLHPAIRLRGETQGFVDPARGARRVQGVELATSILLGAMTLAPDGPDGEDLVVDVAAVSPPFRLLTPAVTAQAVDVWRRVAEGDAAFVHEVGEELGHVHGIELGGRVPLAGAEEQTLRIGAYASNGAPPVADVVISRAAADDLGVTGETVVLVAVAEGFDPGDVAAALEEATGLSAEVVPEPAVRRAFMSRTESREAFEPFSYVSLGDGMIQIERDWVRQNIVSARVPIFRGPVTCHRLMIPQLRGALQEIEDRGLADLIDPSQYGGCWVPRHILFNPRRVLSMHAWGLAIDFNVSTNKYGANPELDGRIVEIFERWGFSWGGDWSVPDGMHFELAVLLDGGTP